MDGTDVDRSNDWREAPGSAAWEPFRRALCDLGTWEERAGSEKAESGQASSGRSRIPEADAIGCLVAVLEDGAEDEVPLGELLRLRGLPSTEEAALDLCRGRVLDVGSGAGAHSLRLQESMGRNRALTSITALDAQLELVDLARRRGVADARTGDVLGPSDAWRGEGERWDTLLFMMNGLGLSADLGGLEVLLDRCGDVLARDGVLLADGCDLRRSPDSAEKDRIAARRRQGRYFGETRLSMRYTPHWRELAGRHRPVQGEPFGWLYVDHRTLSAVCRAKGWSCQVVVEDGPDYLARISRAS